MYRKVDLSGNSDSLIDQSVKDHYSDSDIKWQEDDVYTSDNEPEV